MCRQIAGLPKELNVSLPVRTMFPGQHMKEGPKASHSIGHIGSLANKLHCLQVHANHRVLKERWSSASKASGGGNFIDTNFPLPSTKRPGQASQQQNGGAADSSIIVSCGLDSWSHSQHHSSWSRTKRVQTPTFSPKHTTLRTYDSMTVRSAQWTRIKWRIGQNSAKRHGRCTQGS